MRLATSYVDISGQCQIRPISETDIDRLSIPRLPSDALTWLYQNPHPMGLGGLLHVAGKPKEADFLLLMQSDRHLMHDGSRLLQFLLSQAKTYKFERLVAMCNSLRTPYARFLTRNGFQLSYEEWDMWRDLPYADELPRYRLRTLPEHEGAALMRKLYAESFEDERWYLPYTSDTHLLDEFGVDSDLLFLFDGETPVGFTGVSYEGNSADIEVFGVAKPYRYRRFGKALMQSLLHHLASIGCTSASLSLWKDNKEGLRLAQSFGFYRTQTRVYLEYLLDT